MERPIPILLYHSIDTGCDPDYRRWMMLPDEFDRQMNVLREENYSVLTVAQLAALRRRGAAVPERTALITFDDGLHDFLTGAMPILSKYGFPASLFVVSGCVGKTSVWLSPLGEGLRRMLDYTELRELARAGIEIGAHSISHPELDVIASSRALVEIGEGKRHLEDGLGQSVLSFAYPHGYSNHSTRRQVKDSGFQAACRVGHAFSSPTEDPMLLSRIIITSDIGPEDLRRMLSTPSLPIAPPADRFMSHAWRLVRRLRYATSGMRRPSRRPLYSVLGA